MTKYTALGLILVANTGFNAIADDTTSQDSDSSYTSMSYGDEDTTPYFDEQASWIIRFGYAGFMFSDSSNLQKATTDKGLQGVMPDKLKPKSLNTFGASITYLIPATNDGAVGFELFSNYPSKMKWNMKNVKTGGKLDYLTSKYLQTGLTAQYYFTNVNSHFVPYVGAGVSYNRFSDIKEKFATQGSITPADYTPNSEYESYKNLKSKLKSGMGGVLQAGIDFYVTPSFLLNASATYSMFKSKATTVGDFEPTGDATATRMTFTDKIKLNPWTLRLNAGFRF